MCVCLARGEGGRAARQNFGMPWRTKGGQCCAHWQQGWTRQSRVVPGRSMWPRDHRSKIGHCELCRSADGTTVDNLECARLRQRRMTERGTANTIRFTAKSQTRCSPRPNATPTLTIDASFWTGNLPSDFLCRRRTTDTIGGCWNGIIDRVTIVSELHHYMPLRARFPLSQTAKTSPRQSRFEGWLNDGGFGNDQVVFWLLLEQRISTVVAGK